MSSLLLLMLLDQSSDPVLGDQIVVTSERREQSYVDVAESISVIGSEALNTLNADHPSEAINRSAGVLIHRGSGQEHLTSIRSPVLTGGAGAGSFLFLENGIPLRAPGFSNVNGLFEAHTEIAERIEIVRGPSGPLYGANAIHGVINVIAPGLGDDQIFLDTSIDTIGRIKGRGIVSRDVANQQVLIGLSVLDDPGFRLDSGVDQQKLTLRHRIAQGAVSVTTSFSAANLNQETAGFVQGEDAFLDPVLRRSNPNPEAFRDVKSARLSSEIVVDQGGALSFRVTPYARWTDMDFLQHFLPSQALEENSHYSVGFQSAVYSNREGPISFIAGVDVDFTEGELTEVQSLPTIFSFTQGVHYDYEVDALSVSLFVNGTVDLTPHLSATFGGRLDYTRYDYNNRTEDGVVGRFLRLPDRQDAFTTFSPKVSLQYEQGFANFFVRYARGARPPQTTDLYRLQVNQTEDSARPEFIDAIELGVKAAGENWWLGAAVYAMEKENFFFRDADGFNVDNGRTRHIGGELEGAIAFSQSVSIDFNVSHGRHTYRFDRPVNSFAQATEAIAFGNVVDTAPRWLAGARFQWQPEFAPVRSELEWTFVDDYFLDAANTRTYPGHSIISIRSEYRLSSRISAYFSVRNLLNNFIADRADFAFGSERYFPGEGRVATFGIRFSE